MKKVVVSRKSKRKSIVIADKGLDSDVTRGICCWGPQVPLV